MNILFLTDGITPYVTGGMQQFASVLVKLLLNKNISITLVHCGVKGSNTFTDDLHTVFSTAETEQLETVFIPFLNKGKWPGHYIYENKVYSKLIFDHMKNRLDNFDFIYAQGFTGWAFGKQPMKPKLLVNFHGFEMFQRAPSKKVKLEHYMLRPFVKTNCLQADYVYSFGGKITKIIRQIGIPSTKILNQSNGIESKWINKLKPSQKPLRFIFVGRNERRKGIDELTKALLLLKQKNAFNFSFTFIGPIPENQKLANVVTYQGEIKNQTEIHNQLKQADVLVCPSYAEGMPTVILEAMANGLAIITSDVGASSKMIKGNGIILDHISPGAICQAIEHVNDLTNSAIDSMKKKSLELVKSQFIWEVIVENMISDLTRLKPD